jgi:hypothetical protein
MIKNRCDDGNKAKDVGVINQGRKNIRGKNTRCSIAKQKKWAKVKKSLTSGSP